MVPLSVLDLAPVATGSDVPEALKNSLDLAQHAERWGYRRFWLAEHHNMPGIASAATSLVISHVAGGTRSIRVGAGGIMLPNHSPLVIAEQFGTLDALYPGRIDLGVGRAPGTDPLTARALRRTLTGSVDGFPDDLAELLHYFDADVETEEVRAIPGAGAKVETWILGSSLFGAQFAATLGLPYAFASHFAPAQLTQAIDVYRTRFRPSKRLAEPHWMLGVNIIAADTDQEARLLLTSLQQMFVALRRGKPGKVPPPRAGFEADLTFQDRGLLEQTLSCSFVGSVDTIRRGLETFVERTGAHEIIVSSLVYDHAARLRSYELVSSLISET